MPGSSDASDADAKSKLSRRKFLLSSAATAASAAITVNSERANAFFNTFGFMKKSSGNGQTSNGYTIGQSLRFNSANSNYLNWPLSSFASGMNTFSFWVKRGKLSVQQGLWSAYATGQSYTWYAGLRFEADDTLYYYDYRSDSGVFNATKTTMLFRDPSAWYHIVVTAGAPLKIYVNGIQQTLNATVNPSYFFGLNIYAPTITSGQYHIGHDQYTNTYFDGYLTEVIHLTGQTLDSSNFGQVDATNGQWIPKAYSGAYGVNGFYLKFTDNSDVTATTLGKDSATIGGAHVSANNWTPTGFNAHDQVLDSPTNNFCTLNPLDENFTASPSLNSGNLAFSLSSNPVNQQVTRGTIYSHSPFYFEWTCASVGVGGIAGVISSQPLVTAGGPQAQYTANAWELALSNGKKVNNGPGVTYGSAFSANDVGMCAVDPVNGNIWWGKNGTWFGTPAGDPASGANPAYTGLATILGPVLEVGSSSDSFIVNFGQGGQTGLAYDGASGGRFKYTPPAGFKTLCTANLPAPVIKSPSQHFAALTYNGDGVSSRTITGMTFTPDFIWLKNRSTTLAHTCYDSVRGFGPSKALGTNSTSSESLGASNEGYLNAVGSGSLQLEKGTDPNSYTNLSGHSYVAWCWKKGAIPGFDVVTYTGSTGGTTRTVSHNLGTIPKLMLIKNRTSAFKWAVYHASIGASAGLSLNTTDPSTAMNTVWNSTEPTSALFSIGASGAADWVNAPGADFIAYLWAEVPGFSKFGSYTGNGSANGPFVYCGFKPRYVMVKRCDSAQSWVIVDSCRDAMNPVGSYLLAESAGAEPAKLTIFDYCSNGFKVRCDSSLTGINASGGTYIFVAFAEAPFKYATAR